MKVKEISYTFLKNMGNYQHKEIGVTVELEEHDTPSQAFKRAKAFVEKALDYRESNNESEIKQLSHILNNEDDYAPKVLRDAKERWEKLVEAQDDDIPF